MFRFSSALSMICFWTLLSHGQISITSVNNPYSQNFDSLAFNGTSTTVPTGWAFLETGANQNTTYNSNNGSSSAGNTYSYGASSTSERAFGTLLNSNLTSRIGAQFTNNTGTTITELSISYDGELWRRSETNRSDTLQFGLSTTATGLSDSFNFTVFSALNFVSTPGSTTTTGGVTTPIETQSISSTISGLSIADGTTFWIRWLDLDAVGGGDTDDGMAIDNFVLTANPVPEPASLIGFSALGVAAVSWIRRRRAKWVSKQDLSL